MVELAFEYGPRVGCWRLLRIFRRFDIKISVLGVVRGLQQYPELAQAFVEDGHEIVSHGWRWLDYHKMSEKNEREHIRLAFEGIKTLVGEAPLGWFNGRPSINTRRLVVEHGGFLYDRDYLGDELPFWVRYGKRDHLVIPFSFETNDNRFDQNNGFSTADEFARYLIDCFDLLYEEGEEIPKIMSVSLHDRLIGRPAKGRADQISRPRSQARPRLVLYRERHCATLASKTPAKKLMMPDRYSPRAFRLGFAAFKTRILKIRQWRLQAEDAPLRWKHGTVLGVAAAKRVALEAGILCEAR